MKIKITILVAFFLIGANNYAQQKICYSEQYMQEKLQDPIFRAEYEVRQKAFQKEYKRLLANPEEILQTIFIPVAVHFLNADESNRACLEDLARDQIRIMNEDFSATNAEVPDWNNEVSQYFPGVVMGSLDIKFVLATKNHPPGVDPDIVEGGPAVSIGDQVSDSDRRWAGYQNMIIKTLPGTALGYSPLGGSPSKGWSVVIDDLAFGSGSGCPGYVPKRKYDMGRVAIHELGHFYNLLHIWGSNIGCEGDGGDDDEVEDTPDIRTATSRCVSPGSIVMCDIRSLTMNYMDYTPDACKFMFTRGQAVRMNAYINTIKDDWKTDVLSTDSFEINKVYSIYPNPANDKINISLISNAVREASYEVYDIVGKTIFKGDLSLDNNTKSRTINTSELTNGVYLLKVDSENLTATKKIVIKH